MNKNIHFVLYIQIFYVCLLGNIKFANAQITDVILDATTNGTTVNTCGAALHDSGGTSGIGYSDNENFYITICPDIPGEAISIDFVTFALSNVNTVAGGPCAGNADYIEIWDGDNTSATYLGSYTCSALAGLEVYCTSMNTSGCLTLHFKSNSSGTGVFAGSISCSTPCTRPTAQLAYPVVGEVQKICQGESVSFDGTPSYAAAGFTITDYHWNFGDGTLDTISGPVVTHSFAEPGEYLVDLFVFDDNDCAAANRVTVPVWVSTTPHFTGTSLSQDICIGTLVCLTGQVNEVTYTGNPLDITGDTMFVPDEAGSCFGSGLNINVFTPGQTLTTIDDLYSINTVFEHSFMGDLVISITCPDGTQVVMHQQGGGGTYLGEPVNIAGPADPPGVGWYYGWSPTSTLGTWADNGTGGTLPEGLYESVNPLDSLVGCPLNGTWTFEMCDLWGLDDGWVFEWGIDFNPAIFPDITEFTPQIGAGPDSSFWQANDPISNLLISSLSPNGDNICINGSNLGEYHYNYVAIDDFGCTYDTTITISVVPFPIVDAGPDQITCPGVPVNLEPIINGEIPASSCTYSVDMQDTFGDGWNGYTLEVYADGILIATITLASGSSGTATFDAPPSTTIVINSQTGFFLDEISYQIYDPDGLLIYSEGVGVTVNDNEWSGDANCADISWSPGVYLSDSTIASPSADVPSTTEFILTAAVNGCAATDTMTVISYSGNEAELIGPDTMICNAQNVQLNIDVPLPAGSIIAWSTPIMANLSDPTIPNPICIVTAPTFVAVNINLPIGCNLIDTLNILFAPPMENVYTSDDMYICQGQQTPLAVVGGVSWNWYPDNTLSCDGCPDPVASPTASTLYYVQIFSEDGCHITDSIQVYVSQAPDINIIEYTIQVYEGEAAQIYTEGSNYTFIDWTPTTYLLDTFNIEPTVIPESDQTYIVTVYNLDSTCIDYDTVFIDYMGCRGFKLATAFSPNGDALNDILYVLNSGFESFEEFSIYNRLGTQVFTTTDISRGWDGTYNGLAQEIGTYVYVIRGTCKSEIIDVKGNVTLVR